MPGSRSQTPASTSSGPSTGHTSATLNGRAASSTASPRRSGETDGTQEEDDSGRRRHRLGGSAGGFLLDSLASRTRSSPTSRRYGSLKGKAKTETGPERVSTPERHSTHLDGHFNGSAASPGDEDSSRGSQGTPELPLRPASYNPYGQTRRHDPAQLVNIALQLNQNRQRQASARFQPHTAGAGVSGRVVSTGSAPPLGLSPHRDIQRNPVTAERELTAGAVIANGLGTQQQDSLGTEGYTDLDGPAALEFYPSPQTLIRAERARIALELKYHHRRVLQHVPRLPAVKDRRPETAGTETSEGSKKEAIFGRAYNPLQYTRNRRIRMQKRSPIDPEKDGWHDLERVTAWVNEVAAQRHVHISSLNDNYPLPPFLLESSQLLNQSIGSIENGGQAKLNNRVVRPRNDWAVAAPDLLADLYWLQQDENRRLIEDRNGDKIFPPAATSSNKNAVGRRRSLFDLKRRSASISRKSVDSDRGPDKGKASTPAISREHSPEKQFHDHKRDSPKPGERKGSKLGPFARKRPNSPSVSSSEDERGDRLKFSRPWSKTFGKNWEGTSMPGRISLDQSRYNKDPEHGVRSSFDVKSARQSQESRRPFSIELHPPAEEGQSSLSRQETFSDLDSTAPNSPVHRAIVPSMATDFDSEAIFGPPPAKRVKSRSRHDRHHEVEQMDFAAEDPSHVEEPDHSHNRRQLKPLGKAHTTALSSPSETSFSADSEKPHKPHLKRHETERMALRTPEDSSFRFPKSWKVPKHVAGRVGDLLRRKDYASDTSETDDDTRQKGIRMQLTRAVTASTTGRGTLSRSSTLSAVGESPGYRPPEMPSFSSVRREGHTGSPSRLDTSESISQRLSKENGDYLSPASVGLKSPSRSLTPQLSRMVTAEDKDSLTSSRQTSGQTSGNGRRGATVTDTAGKQWPLPNRTNGAAWPGETGDGSEKTTWTGPELKPTKAETVTESDIMRTEAMLRSLCVKAANVVQTFQCVSATPGRMLADTYEQTDSSQLPVAKIEEPTLLSTRLTKRIDNQTNSLNQAAEMFINDSIHGIDKQLDGIKSIVQDKLTAMVLTAGDNADGLGHELSAGLTREVRDINDSIDQLLRARRRQSRLIRRTAFQLLEWTIMAIMWALWLLVVTFKTVRGALSLGVAMVRWLLLL